MNKDKRSSNIEQKQEELKHQAKIGGVATSNKNMMSSNEEQGMLSKEQQRRTRSGRMRMLSKEHQIATTITNLTINLNY